MIRCRVSNQHMNLVRNAVELDRVAQLRLVSTLGVCRTSVQVRRGDLACHYRVRARIGPGNLTQCGPPARATVYTAPRAWRR